MKRRWNRSFWWPLAFRGPGRLLASAAQLLLVVAMACPGFASRSVQADERPNVVFLLADDQRPDTIHALGNEPIQTPHLDRLVHEGTAFTRAIAAIPICVASRAEILTGRDGLKNGRRDFGFSPADGVPTWSSVMREAGFDTCYVGKWHTPGRPSQHGYSRSEGLFGPGAKLPPTYFIDWKGMPVTGYVGWVFQTDDGQMSPELGVGLMPNISETFADAAIAFLSEPHERPFFLHVNFTAPHDPLLVPKGYENLYDPEEISLPPNFAPQHLFDHGNARGRDEKLFSVPRTPVQTRGELAVYYAVISHLDAQVGRILDVLQQNGQLDNTLVIYSSDHGLAIGSHGLRGKQNMYEHSVGVPLILRGPGIPQGQLIGAQCYLRDLFPTACSMAGITIPESVNGKDLMPVVRGETDSIYDAVFAHFRDSQRMIRTDEWKYIRYPLAHREQLFHLATDPDELTNLASDPEHAETLTQLRQRLSDHFR